MLKPINCSCICSCKYSWKCSRSATLGRAILSLVATALMLGLLALAPAKPAAADPPAVAGVTWTPTFCDDFTADYISGVNLDQSKWETGTTWPYQGALGPGTFDFFGDSSHDYPYTAGYPYYGNTASPAVTVDANGLSLRSARESYTDVNHVTHNYTSGAINTDRKFAQVYGYFECNFQAATEAGIDPAFWLYRRAPDWGAKDFNEIDIVEVPSDPFPNGVEDNTGDIIYNNIHSDPGVNLGLTNVSGFPAPNDPIREPAPLQAQSHTYGVDFEPGTVTFYLDGTPIRSDTYTPQDAQLPLSIHLNQELSNDSLIVDGNGNVGQGHWFGNPDSLATYQTVFAHAKWVKAWTRATEGAYPSLPSFPGTVQAAKFDTGGQGISYNQSRLVFSTPQPLYNRPDQNNLPTGIHGAAYSNSADGSTPDFIGSTSTGQWYKYTVNVATPGFYTLSFAASTNNNGSGYTGAYGGRFYLEDWTTATATGKRITDIFSLNSPQANVNGTNNYVPVTVSNSNVHLTFGTHVFRWVQDFRDYGDDFNLFSMTATLTQADNGPFNGPHNIPGTVQCEDYDVGGQGMGYNIAGNSNGGSPGTVYRSDNNGNVATGSGSGGNNYQIGWNYAGEWYNYTVNATQAGTYTATFQYTSGGPGGTFHLEDEHANKLTGPLTVQNTYSWSTFATVTSTPFTLLQGPHTLKLVMDTNGPYWFVGNFDDFTVALSQPNNGPHNIPGTIQSDDYDKGGEGVGYHIAPPATPQAGSGYRADNNTHIYAENAPGGNGYVLGWSGASDWYDYSVNVTTAANYTATFQVQTGGPGGTFHLEDENHNNLTGSLSAPDTGGWGSAYWKPVTSPAFVLTAGPHILHLAEDTVAAGGWVCDFSWMQLGVAASGAPITGTEFDDGAGPWGPNWANVASNAFDGDVSTFYDCANSTGFVGIDAGVPTTVTSIVYAPRPNLGSHMVGGIFEGSNTSATTGYTTLATVPSTATVTNGLTNTLTVTNATPYRWLRYRDSQGGYCNVAEIQFIDPPIGIPALPTGLKAAAGAAGTKKVTLTWAAASGATSYHILRSPASGYTGTKALAVNITGLSYTDSGLTAGTTYYYKITAVNAKGGTFATAQVSAKAQ